MSEEFHNVTINSCFMEAKRLEDDVVAEAVGCGYDEECLFALRLSLEEAFANAIRHGNVEDVNKHVRVRYRVSPERIDVYVADEGKGFDVNLVPDPTREENLERPTGRGIMLMRAYMNLVEYNDPGNMVHLVKMNQAS